MGLADESEECYFQRAGAIPFKWEIRPGVPKPQFLQPETEPKPKPKPKQPPIFLSPPELTPPPSGSIFLRPLESRGGSFRSVPRTRSERWRFDRTAVGASLKRNESTRMSPKVAAPHYSKDLETLARWSMSRRRSLSPPLFSDASSLSPSSQASSYWSHQSSPRPVSDAEWAAFGLF